MHFHLLPAYSTLLTMELAVVCVIIKVANGTEVVETKLQPTVAAIVGNLHTEGGGGGGASYRLVIHQNKELNWEKQCSIEYPVKPDYSG